MPSWATCTYHTRLSPLSSDCQLVLVQVSDPSQPWPGVGRPTSASTRMCGQHVCVGVTFCGYTQIRRCLSRWGLVTLSAQAAMRLGASSLEVVLLLAL